MSLSMVLYMAPTQSDAVLLISHWTRAVSARPRHGAVHGGGAPPSPAPLRRQAGVPFRGIYPYSPRPSCCPPSPRGVSGAAITGSKDALDERMLPPVSMSAWQNRRPFNFSTCSIIEHPSLDSRFAQTWRLSTCKYPEIFARHFWLLRHIVGEGANFQTTDFNSGIHSAQNFFEWFADVLLGRQWAHAHRNIKTIRATHVSRLSISHWSLLPC